MSGRPFVPRALLLLLAGAVLASCATNPSPPIGSPEIEEKRPLLVGTVIKVTDGDTIHVQLSSGPIKVRFHSIDAPEMSQPWGPSAAAALAGRIDRKQVALEVVEQDRYDRLVSVVHLGDENINEWMLRQGHAWAYRQYLQDSNYCVLEADARLAERGLWSLPPDDRHAPWEYRHEQTSGARRFTDYRNESVANCVAAIPKHESVSPGSCRIKGDISADGKIYHVPGSPAYDRTLIDVPKGERWFCTEEQARQAGWRPPKGRGDRS